MLLLATIDGRDHHETGDWHPEQPARLGAALRGVDEAGLGDAVVRVEPREATLTELMRVHPLLYIDALEQLSDAGGGELDPDTVVSTGSAATARLAAGTGIAAIEALERGDGDVAFVAVRPPGHHARRDRGMGFCLYNNVAVAAAALATKGERVLVLDWDVHHGNGTQDIFWNDPNVLYVSTHQAPLYPGTGRISETGGDRAPGSIVNLPFPAGTTGDVFLRALDEVVEPIVSAFAPTWVLASAGFDAHRDDPLAELQLTSGDFADIAARVAAYAPQRGRLALFLEGGYDLDALRRSIAASLSACFDSRIPCERSSSGGPGVETVGAAKRIREQLAERGVS
ncbi:MAG: histone deacetylase family protein [Acidimicrobiia bacterium]